MIADNEKNIIYFSDLIKSEKKYKKTCEDITGLLDLFQIKYDFLPYTKDIWARDYMPIQVSKDKFIEYRYDPDYLQNVKYRKLKTYPDLVCNGINIKTIKTDIILDGGNVIKSKNAVILTDKIVHENIENYSKQELSDELKRLFETERIIYVPWDRNEPYGHADGMLRFIDEQNVVINGYFEDYEEEFKNKLYISLEEYGIRYLKLNYSVANPDPDRNWAYINFLQTKDILLVPGLDIEEDRQALEKFEKLFPDYAERGRIIQIDVSPIVAEGGALNCISWTVKQ